MITQRLPQTTDENLGLSKSQNNDLSGMITQVKRTGFSWDVTFQRRHKPDGRVIIINLGIDRRWKS